MEVAASSGGQTHSRWQGDLFALVDLLHNVNIPDDVSWAGRDLCVTSKRTKASKRVKVSHPGGASWPGSPPSAAGAVTCPQDARSTCSVPGSGKLPVPPQGSDGPEISTATFLVDAASIAQTLPQHLVCCFLLHSNVAGPTWGSGIAQRPPAAVGPLQHVMWGMDSLARLCEHVPNFPTKVLEGDPLKGVRRTVLDLVFMLLMGVTGPLFCDFQRETNNFMRQDLASDTTRIASSCFTLLAQALSPENSASDGDVDWQVVCENLLSYPKSRLLVPLLFDVTGILMRMVEVMAPIMCQNNTDPESTANFLATLGGHVGNCVGNLAALCSIAVFYHGTMILDPSGLSPLGLLVSGLRLWNLKDQVGLPVAGTLTLMAARCCALMLVLSQHCEPDFLEHSMTPGSESRPHMAHIASLVKAMLVSYSFETLQETEVITDQGSPQLYVNLLRLAEIFAEETNFRDGMIVELTRPLAAILCSDTKVFESWWCGGPAVQQAHLQDVMWVYSVTYSAFVSALQMRACAAELIQIKDSKRRAWGKALPVGGPEPDLEKVREMCLERAVQLCKLLVNLHYFCEETCEPHAKNQFVNGLIAEWGGNGAPKEVRKLRVKQAIKNLKSLCKLVNPLFPGNRLGLEEDTLLTTQDQESMTDFISALQARVNG